MDGRNKSGHDRQSLSMRAKRQRWMCRRQRRLTLSRQRPRHQKSRAAAEPWARMRRGADMVQARRLTRQPFRRRQPTVIQPSYAVSIVTFLSYTAVVSRSRKHYGGFPFTSAFQLPNCDAPLKRVIASQWQCCPRQATHCVLRGSHKTYRARISADERPLPRQRSCKGDRQAEKRSDPRRHRSAPMMRRRGCNEVGRAFTRRGLARRVGARTLVKTIRSDAR